ncbi:MAG: hypothetical protein M3Y32_13865, partial [Pseudomonadota bacterium]|nr:hypothetical protein [Pseudomonadota bacterium]
GDFHNHTTCSDGSISVQKLIKKATDTNDGWGLDWFVQAGHGGNGNRNCTLLEDESLATPAYPYVAGQGPNTTWAQSIGAAAVKGNVGGTNTTPLATQADPRMWRWQSIQEFSYPVTEYLTNLKGVPVFMGMESVVPGHEHTSMSIITGQLPELAKTADVPAETRSRKAQPNAYVAAGNATALSKWSYCFDRGDTDNSRGGGQNWECSVPGSNSSADPSWSALAAKLMPAGGAGTGVRGHLKTVEAVKWMAAYHPDGSYYVPAHLERAGPFNPDGNNGFNVEHLRNFNNAGPRIAFGFETQPGHGASQNRGEYSPERNSIGGVQVDSVGGTTYGGTGVYGAQIGGVWDALLGEGRNYWFFASSDWHNRGQFGADDRRTTQDFQPGEYQRNYTLVRNGSGRIKPQTIVDGLRSGNNFAASGQLIDRLAFIACASYKGPGARSNAAVEALALNAARNDTDIDVAGCATMGEKLVVRPGAEIVVAIVVRDPSGSSNSPYTFNNPSLSQVGISQALNQPALDHIDVIRGMVSGYKTPGAADYAGQWPNTWLQNPDLATVPAAAKNTTAALIKTFTGGQASGWTTAGNDLLKMSFRLPAVVASQYLRLRGTNLPPSVPFETDADGNPLADIHTNASTLANLRIPCNVTGTTQFDGCPSHLGTVNGQKYVSFDVAAWADLWFYSNPIYVEVTGATAVAGVQ